MLPCETPPSHSGFFSQGDSTQGGAHRQGHGFSYGGPPLQFPFPAQQQQMVPYASYGQTLHATDYETGHILGEVPASMYTPSETSTEQASQEQSCQQSPMPQSSKGQPLD